MIDLLDRYKGAILGLACGDAVGTTLEFKSPGSFTPITDMTGGGPFALKAGQWTDDTSMMLCLSNSIIECDGFNPFDQMTKYIDWYKNGYMSSTGECFDIGVTVALALNKFEVTHESFCGSTDPLASGNGSLTRLAPIPLAYRKAPEKALEFAELSSRTTHASTIAIDACRLMTAVMLGVLNGIPKEEVLRKDFSPLEAYWQRYPLCPEINLVAKGSYKSNSPPFIRGSGYAAKSLEAALWAFYNTDSFVEGCLMAANLGDDADTTAAIYGQLAGSYYGSQGIPSVWLDKLWMRKELEHIATQLSGFASRFENTNQN